MTSDIRDELYEGMVYEKHGVGAGELDEQGTDALMRRGAAEIDRLRARLDELEGQEPVGEIAKTPTKRWASVDMAGYDAELKTGDKLYAAPPASRSEAEVKAEGLPKRVRENIAMLLDEAAVEERSNDPEAGMPADDETADGVTYLAARLRGDGEES